MMLVALRKAEATGRLWWRVDSYMARSAGLRMSFLEWIFCNSLADPAAGQRNDY